jgi:transcriptional regulator with XRE-family HTH domain
MARAALGWGVRDLAGAASVAVDTVARFERGETLKDRTVDALRRALEAGGIALLWGDAPGVRLLPVKVENHGLVQQWVSKSRQLATKFRMNGDLAGLSPSVDDLVASALAQARDVGDPGTLRAIRGRLTLAIHFTEASDPLLPDKVVDANELTALRALEKAFREVASLPLGD